ncbi:uncharacterized protein RHOBADRAFT_43607 [Rhodotorula graminis WP1]|uniref:Zn(2)-C6 fungal-type domain-containing protein n=1 Tax=Rhodotorula graminis (strain WP1) TaxID=578459 RepID=A0A194S3F1_RHOGW|nr:uncharacterized protein RHOBADRAFT_43607 [Rhodotorula graminis WP1]KPV75117.1 hypothetical protein RHOBADRAFT_43607 [Rhodotorula graminis WP1]
MQPLQPGGTGPLPALQQFQQQHPSPHLHSPSVAGGPPPLANNAVVPGQPTHPVQLAAHDSMYPAHVGHPLQQQQHLPPLAPQQHPSSSRPGSSSGPPLHQQQHMQPPPHLMTYPTGGASGSAGTAGSSAAAAPAQQQQPPKKGTKRAAPDSNGKDKEKKTRSKAACSQCKAVKQKCEGPPYVPCRRCELYKLECKFPPGTKTVPRPVEASSSGSAAAGGAEPSSAVTAKLFEIASRLQTIESALHIASAPSPAVQSSDTHSHAPRSPSARSSDDGGPDDDDGGDGSTAGKAAAATANPIGEINATVDSLAGFKSGPRQSIMEMNDYGAPDVLRRAVLTPVECQQLFDFFFASLHPWIMMLSLDDDRDAMAVRDKSPLLFHTILLLSTAYSTPFPSQLHLTLVTFLNNILAPQLLNPQPHELTTDFLRALDLLNIYKPVQFGARRTEGHDDTEAMRVSKVNGLASWMLQGILARTAERLELKETVSKFARAYSASASGAPVPKQLLRDLRLYYWLLSNDVHGNVQSGRRCNMEGSQALTTTRLFSSLHLQPFDVRLAASVEMFEVARPILRSYSYERTRRIPKPDLERYNAGMRSFDETWIPVLLRQLAVDPLAMTVISPFREFITLQFNATCYVSYKSTRLYASSSDGGGSGSGNEGGGGRPTSSGGPEGRAKRLRTEGPRGLNDWEYDGLAKCVRSAELLVFSLSEESRVPGAWRVVQWEEAERADGWRKLILDDQMVEQSRWGMDAITCVAYIFPLVFLSKLVNEGLLTTNLTLLRTPASQPAWHYTQKLPRLLELGAAFLDAVGTSPHHPSRAQAHVVRTLLETGIKGRLPTPLTGPKALGSSLGLLDGGGPGASSPGGTGPSHAATVMSPSPQSQPQPLAPVVDQGQSQMGYPQGGIPYPPVPQQSGGGLPYPATTGADGRPNWAPPSFTPTSTGAGAGGLGQSMYTSSSSSRAGGQAPPEHSPGAAHPPPPVMIPGMDDALGSVLNDFEPLFGETDGGFWEWAGLSGGNNLVQPQP